jgi:hypothetical protein
MTPVIINARWTIDGYSVLNSDYFSVLLFVAYFKLAQMHDILTEQKFSFKNNPERIKLRFNHKFKYHE